MLDSADPEERVGTETPALGPDYVWFVGGVVSWFGAWGLQGTLFSWLLVGELQLSAEWVGIAQTSTMLPSLFLILLGGAFADRRDPRQVLIVLHVLAVLPVLLLASAVFTQTLDVYGLIAFGLCVGTISAFAMPARDTLLSRVAGANMMRAVTTMTVAQFAAQSLGTLIAAGAAWVGSVPMLGVQACVLLLGALVTLRIARGHLREVAPSTPAAPSMLHEIAEGLRMVAATPNLRVPLMLVLSVGAFFIGPFMVIFPLLVRDFYQGGPLELAIVMSLFPLGTIVGSGLILARGGIGRKGLAALTALLFGALALAAIGTGLPFWGMIGATFFWGVCGAYFINCSRTLYQEAAPDDQRGRVMAVYQLGFMGAAPPGSIVAGFVSGAIGPLVTMICFAGAMLVLVALVALFSNALRMR